MSYTATSIQPSVQAPWRVPALQSAASATASSSSGNTASARDADAPDQPPLVQAMLATLTVTGADAGAATGNPANAADAVDASANGKALQDAVLGFSQAVLQAMRDHGTAAGAVADSQALAQYGGAEALAPRIGALAQRIESGGTPAAADATPDAGAATTPENLWPTQRAVRRVMEAFTQLQRAMGKPIPEGAQAQREALGEFLDRLAQSFRPGSAAGDSTPGSLLSLSA